MEIHTLKVSNIHNQNDITRIKTELSKLYDVKNIEVNIVDKEIRLVIDELGCLNSCKTILNNLGYKLMVDGKNKKSISKKLGFEVAIPNHLKNEANIPELV
ncbi:MAG: hypothetical protein SFY32_13400 [Bacteroidota bacterium]|nr:hypothetical protein [Bacteroidota bacterium]